LERLHLFAVGLLIFSALLTIISYFLLSNIPLAALAIGMIILAISILLTPLQSFPPQAIRALLEGSALSLEAILEEFDISMRGYYVQANDGRVYLYVPLKEGLGPPIKRSAPSGLVHVEDSSRYLSLIPPASELTKASEISGMSLESALTYILVDLTEIADAVEVTFDEVLTIRMKNVKPHVAAGRFNVVFGSLEASIAACLAASLLGPVRIIKEVEEEDSKLVILEVVEHE